MRSVSVATGTRRPVRAPEPHSLPRVTRASWRRLPCALQEAPPSRRAEDEPAVTRTWPLVWSRRGYIRAPPSAPAHARGWWWLAPTVGFQKPKDMLGQCGTMSDARGSSSGRRRRPLSNVSATGTTSAPGACLRSRLRRGDAPTLPPNLPRYIVAKATGLGRSVANGRRMQFETRLFRSGSVVRFGVLRPGPSAHVGEGKPPPRKFHVGWAYGLLIVAGFCTWGGMLLLLCCNFCLPSRAPCWLGSAAGGSRRL